MTDVKIRRATHEDSGFLASAILMTTRSHLSRGWFDISLDRPENLCLDFLARLTTTTARSQWHYSRCRVACIAERPVATLAWMPADAYSKAPAAILEALKSLGFNEAERALFWKRGESFFTCIARPADGSLSFETGATLADFRGRGYVAALFASAFEYGRAHGFWQAESSCFIGNEASERLHERVGFRCVRELRHPDFEAVSGAPGMRRFVRQL